MFRLRAEDSRHNLEDRGAALNMTVAGGMAFPEEPLWLKAFDEILRGSARI
jgi:hypothetical protein